MKACYHAWVEQHSDWIAQDRKQAKYRFHCAIYNVSNKKKFFLHQVISFDESNIVMLDDKAQTIRWKAIFHWTISEKQSSFPLKFIWDATSIQVPIDECSKVH